MQENLIASLPLLMLLFIVVFAGLRMCLGGRGANRFLTHIFGIFLDTVVFLAKLFALTIVNISMLLVRLTVAGNCEGIANAWATFVERMADAFIGPQR